jgi:hypothetical protein
MRKWIIRGVVTLVAIGILVVGSSLYFGAGGSAPVLSANGPPITGGTGQSLPAGQCTAAAAETPPTGPSSDLTLSGACQVQELDLVSCTIAVDDFYAVIHRPLTNGRTLYMTLNVETYSHPGSFRNAQLYFEVQGGGVLARWTNLTVAATVAKGGFVTLPGATATAEVGTGAPGPINVSGTMQCAA